MGNQQSNKRSHSKSKSSIQINSEDVEKFKSLTNNREALAQDDVFDLWTLEIRDPLLNFYLKYYFPNDQTRTIDLNVFASLYYGLTSNSLDRRIEILQSFLTSYDDLLVYVRTLIESALFIYRNKEDKQLWANLHLENDEKCLELYSKYLCDISQYDKEISSDSLQFWLSNTHEMLFLHKYVLSNMFRFKTKQLVLPTPFYNPNFTKSILDYSCLIFLNLNLMPEYQSQWRLVFSSHFQGESFTKLLSSLVNQGPLLVVVEDEKSNVFGAFASTNLICSPKFYGDQSSFLFTLKPDFKLFSSSGFNENFIYLNSNQSTLPNGLGFGGQFGYWGLWLDAEYGKGECNQSCSTFRDYKMMSSNKEFRVVHVEVWAVGVPPPTAEERGERSVLDADPTASAIMELAGKTKHSEGLRDPVREIIDDN